MAAQVEAFFQLQRVTDHDCGNYFMGEIWGVDEEAIYKHVERYGHDAYLDIGSTIAKMARAAHEGLNANRDMTSTIEVCEAGA